MKKIFFRTKLETVKLSASERICCLVTQKYMYTHITHLCTYTHIYKHTYIYTYTNYVCIYQYYCINATHKYKRLYKSVHTSLTGDYLGKLECFCWILIF